jgi:hypothetical protein
MFYQPSAARLLSLEAAMTRLDVETIGREEAQNAKEQELLRVLAAVHFARHPVARPISPGRLTV